MEILYDWISCLLWSIEITIIVICIVYCFPAIRFIANDCVLHYNFRVLFITLFIRSIFTAIDRISTIICRVFIYGPADLPFLLWINACKVEEQCQMGCSLVAISIERIFAMVDPTYESRGKKTIYRFLLPIAVIAPPALMTVIFIAQGETELSGIEAYFMLFSYIIASMISPIVYYISKGRLKKRHILRLQLAQKFASNENVRAMRLFIPCVTNEMLCYVILLCLVFYSMKFTPYQMGSDPTKLSHVYDMLGSYKVAFIPYFVTMKYRQMYRKNQANQEDNPETKRKVTDIYFKELQNSWK